VQLEDDLGHEARQCISERKEDREVAIALVGWEDTSKEGHKDLAVHEHREVGEAQRREAEV
jgi:hypothetical protein